jgi:hypothetical protein
MVSVSGGSSMAAACMSKGLCEKTPSKREFQVSLSLALFHLPGIFNIAFCLTFRVHLGVGDLDLLKV